MRRLAAAGIRRIALGPDGDMWQTGADSGAIGFSLHGGGEYSTSPDVTPDVIWPTCATTAQVANDGGVGRAQSRAAAASVPGRLGTSGPERLPTTVCLRFGAGPPELHRRHRPRPGFSAGDRRRRRAGGSGGD